MSLALRMRMLFDRDVKKRDRRAAIPGRSRREWKAMVEVLDDRVVPTIGVVVSVSSNLAPAIYGQSVQLTANVTTTGAMIQPAGTVQFKADGNNLGSPVTVTGDTVSSSIATVTTTTLPVGTHAITAFFTTTNFVPNGDNAGSPFSEKINPATLTVNPLNQDMGHGDAVPALTYTLTGFQNSENEMTAGVTGSAINSTMATSSSPAGFYSIAAGTGTLAASNYVFAAGSSGTLTVHPKVASVNVHWGSQSMNIIGNTRNLPFFNINKVDVQFTDNVDGISGLSGVSLTSTYGGPTYTFNSSAGSSASDAVRGLPSSIGKDKLSLSVSGITAAGLGISLYGPSTFTFNVLPGDFNNDGQVTTADAIQVRNLIAGPYTIWADVNGDGLVDASDVNLIRTKIATHF